MPGRVNCPGRAKPLGGRPDLTPALASKEAVERGPQGGVNVQSPRG
jgi:hypothetical protein